MAGLTGNGVDLLGLGFRPRFTPSLLGGFSASVGTVPLLGRSGGFFTGPRVTPARPVTLRGPLAPPTRTAAALLTAVRRIEDLFKSGRIELIETDSAGATLQVFGVCTGIDVTPLDRKRSPTSAEVAIALQLEPGITDVQPTMRALDIAGARRDIPLGTAPSAYVLNIMGVANNPVVTARAAGGALLWQLTVTKNLDTTNKWLSIDARYSKVWLYESGVKTDGIGLVTGGQADLFRPLDPHDGDYGTSQYMTIEVSPGTGEVLYWKRYG